MSKVKITLAWICYVIGVVVSLYVGGWIMLVQPVKEVIFAYQNKELGVILLMVCAAKILLSSTVAGFIWSVGYIMYNHFNDEVQEEKEKKKEEKVKEEKEEKTPVE